MPSFLIQVSWLVSNPSYMADARHIFCYNIVYKCIIKILANRLKYVEGYSSGRLKILMKNWALPSTRNSAALARLTHSDPP